MKSRAVKFLLTLLAFSEKFNPIILATPAEKQDTFSFLCQDQMVKLGSNIYHLNRLTAALESHYFEKLFTSDDFKQKNDSILEIKSTENDDVFPTILDMIQGKKNLFGVLKKDNYLSILKAMDYFGMEIDLKTFDGFIQDDLMLNSSKDVKIFELYNFIKQKQKLQNRGYEYLLNGLFKHLSKQLDTLQNKNETKLSSDEPLDHLVQLIQKLECLNEETRYHFVPLCAKLTKLNPKIFDSNFVSYSRESDSDDEEIGKYTIMYRRDIRRKLEEFQRNGDLCDITVRIRNTTFKLHRRVLESISGYFKDIFRAEYSEAIAKHNDTLKCPRKDKEYILSKEIDPLTFYNMLMRYPSLYFHAYCSSIWYYQEFGSKCQFYKIAQAFLISHILKIDSLSGDCETRLKDEHERVNSEDVGRILDFTHGKPEYEDVYVIYLIKNLNESWPETNMSQFCSITWTLLEKTLNSSHFWKNDPNKIVEICSKWASHDVRNRYQFLPKIARILNPSCIVNDEEYTTHVVEGLNNRSQQFVRAELWKILSSLPYTICSGRVAKNASRKSEEIPVFFANTESKQTAAILNYNLDVITSINDSDSTCSFEHQSSTLANKNTIYSSATLIDDNLFIIFNMFNPRFQVYNLLLKKCFRLHLDLPGMSVFILFFRSDHYVLLNCNDEIYACSKFEVVAKYSMQLNFWIVLYSNTGWSYKTDLHYTSDGKMLYRMYRIRNEDQSLSYIMEAFDFEKNSWSRLSGLPLIKTGDQDIFKLSMVDDHNFIVLSSSNIIISERNSTCKEWQWKFHEIPRKAQTYGYGIESNFVARCEDRLMILKNNAFFRYYPSNGSFELKKKFSELPYPNIVAIDRQIDVRSKKSA